MKVLVLLKMVPDVVEELEVAPDGKRLNADFLRMIVSECDNHALEQALLLKEKHGGTVTTLALDAPELDDVLFTAAAKGADRVVKITGIEPGLGTSAAARLLAQVMSSIPDLLPADLMLTGCQAIDDLDGQAAPLVSHQLGLPYVGIVSQVAVEPPAGKVKVVREYAGGVRGEFELPMPAVLGIQAAEKPPRYVPVAKVRAAMKSSKIESVAVPTMAEAGPPLVQVLQLAKPEVAAHAEMLEGSPEEISGKVLEILTVRGLS
jgi:electron transfer flavoprotein beta subunit